MKKSLFVLCPKQQGVIAHTVSRYLRIKVRKNMKRDIKTVTSGSMSYFVANTAGKLSWVYGSGAAKSKLYIIYKRAAAGLNIPVENFPAVFLRFSGFLILHISI